MVRSAPERSSVSTDCCTTSVQKRPYAQLGNVETSQDCCGTWSIKTDGLSGPEGGGLAPGTACSNKQLVEEIAAELQARKICRGNVGQIREAELMKQEVTLLHAKVDLILQHLQIPEVDLLWRKRLAQGRRRRVAGG